MRLFPGRKAWVLILITITTLLLVTAVKVMAKGYIETKFKWEGDFDGEKALRTTVSQTLDWTGSLGSLEIPLELKAKINRPSDHSFSLEHGEVTVRPSALQLRCFSNMGFRSTLDPMRLLSSSRRVEGAGGFEVRAIVEPLSVRGLWINHIANVGDDGPLLLLDMSLDPGAREGRYRYLYLTHDSGWNWHHPQAGSYATRTLRQVHSLVGSWNTGRLGRFQAQVATLQGFDAKKAYRRDLNGFALLTRNEGRFADVDWSLELYGTGSGFVLATGDGDSPKPGRQGVGLRLRRSRHRDESLQLEVKHHRPSAQIAALPKDTPGYITGEDPYWQGEIKYRRRWRNSSHRLTLTLATGENVRNPKIAWETTWPGLNILIGGRYGGTSTSQAYGKLRLHPCVGAELRWDLERGWWRTAFELQDSAAGSRKPPRWTGKIVYKQRLQETYTYLSLEHKMEKGYWQIYWGVSDQGRLEWAWNKGPEVGIRLGRYF